ncbi:MAG: 4Fe-4S binding protein [Tidjanibacter sp.]|nr:4Fe-4S binding protein [Tidjanibacter sp.]
MSKHKNGAWWRYLLQFGVLAFIIYLVLRPVWGGPKPDVEAYCPFGGLEAFGSYLHNNSLACSMSMGQIAVGFGLAICVMLAGRLFCGYICPLGTLSEWIGKGGKKLHCTLTIKSGSVADRALRIVKYVLLFVILYFSITSSELFCKKLDPYYALATGFKGEIVLWAACTTIGLFVIGSLLVKQFWCRYICALGALSNIFKYTVTLAVILVVSQLTGLFNVPGAWVWVLAFTCLVCYLYEMITLKSTICPPIRIVRDANKCNGCGLCEKKCPYSIPVQNCDKQVKHIDCTMCTECVGSCPREALTVAGCKKLRWLPAAILVVVAAVAIWLGGRIELPTIDERWGETEQVSELKTFEMTGLTTIKCFGSSKAFSAKMQGLKGVYGVKTFVRTHTVEILYDPSQITVEQIQESIFTPTRRKYSAPAGDSLRVYELGIEGLHDKNDILHFGMMLQFVEGVRGFTAEFACPVKVLLYTEPEVEFSKKELAKIIEVKEFVYPPKSEKNKTYQVDFKLVDSRDAGSVSAAEFNAEMFQEIARTAGRFVDNNAKWPDSPTAFYEVEMASLEKLPVKNAIPYLKSYLSTCDGLMAFEPVLRDGVPTIRLEYVPSIVKESGIWAILTAPNWSLRYADGSIKESEPMMTFTKEGHKVK